MAFPVAHYYCFTICELVQVVGLEVSELWDTDRHSRYEKAEIRLGFFSIDALQTAKRLRVYFTETMADET